MNTATAKIITRIIADAYSKSPVVRAANELAYAGFSSESLLEFQKTEIGKLIPVKDIYLVLRDAEMH